ncbi:hypothetical protein BTU51_1023 [Rickettsia rickettsii]|uniref:Uncharacterized protein n=1 Tax=Rickettsia rickettsii (strain Iowa) TaxID=452659 RepID=B0BYA3_RICRO|nr:hypothetical protein RrIowa_1023 [Rickettsia rickettsii str. Iowa]APU55779.1 hypothetical protein BTU50_1023 [Rickettsia rickettsii]APU57156.1 hypothetical protein BTU51_1023 [Rickettsia rickettsii]
MLPTKIFGHRILNFLEQIMTHNYKSSILDIYCEQMLSLSFKI